jgi:aquaporin Z
MFRALRSHWPEYLMEAALLGLFMISAGLFGTLLEYPHSPVHQAIAAPFLRRTLMGLAMGATAVGIIYSPWGRQSGAHINPATTLTFWRLGKVAGWDALFYVGAQFAGGLLGVFAIASILGTSFLGEPVRAVATVPGGHPAIAFLAEVVITFLLMTVVLWVSNTRRIAGYTGLLVGVLVATYITFEAPVSGMSMNPARSFASAMPSMTWTGWWIYFTAPPIGMLLAADLYLRCKGHDGARCAKMHHDNRKRCIFCGLGVTNLAEVHPITKPGRVPIPK